jgi:hypothetical protein
MIVKKISWKMVKLHRPTNLLIQLLLWLFIVCSIIHVRGQMNAFQLLLMYKIMHPICGNVWELFLSKEFSKVQPMKEFSRFDQWRNPARFNRWRNSARFNSKPMKPWSIHGCINWHVQDCDTCSTLLLF